MRFLSERTRLTARGRRNQAFTEKIGSLIQDQFMPFSIAVEDIDNFRVFNATYGDKIGDMVIAKVVSILRQNTQRSDLQNRGRVQCVAGRQGR